jgi:UDP-N-acetylmuramoyl-tripeptide--D-alanyl-D-alanine ligase
MNLTLEEISAAVSGKLEGPGTVKVTGYSIDTRTLKPGELFVAIKGPRFDGHDFIRQALEKRASAAVIDRPLPSASLKRETGDTNLIRVSSTVAALQELARYVRRRWGMPIIGVTGSAGKTTTKEMIAAVLGKKFTVLRSVGVTNVNPVHLEFFKSVDEIAEAKAELIQGLHDPKVAYLNNDDSRVRAMAQGFAGKLVTYGVKSAASFRVQQMRDLGLDGTAFTVRHGGADFEFVLPLLGQHNVANAMAAITVGATHGLSWDQMREAIGEMTPEKMRGEVIKFREGFIVIDDSYNSNPRALSEMIRFAGGLKGFQRKILVAGEMLELGPESAELHRGCGRDAARAGLTLIMGVQGQAKEILSGALDAGMERSRLKFMRDAVQAGDLLARTVTKGDIVLVKGSRGVRLEQTINTLRAAFSSMEP